MPEREEVEVKFILADPAALRVALVRLGAESHGLHHELNIRLDDSAHSLTARGIVLRLRRDEGGGIVEYSLTVKTPVHRANPLLSIRREIDTTVSDGEALLAALEVLGYRPIMRYEKRRETFILGELAVDIDELPLGWFVEMEGPEADIRQLAAQLGFDLAEGLTLSYAQIFDNVRRALGLDMADLTFEAFAGVDVPPQAYRA